MNLPGDWKKPRWAGLDGEVKAGGERRRGAPVKKEPPGKVGGRVGLNDPRKPAALTVLRNFSDRVRIPIPGKDIYQRPQKTFKVFLDSS